MFAVDLSQRPLTSSYNPFTENNLRVISDEVRCYHLCSLFSEQFVF